MDEKILFDKKCTTIIKGIAIVLMVCHHMWGFETLRDFDGIWIDLAPILIALGKAGKICVAVFAFISGYGIYLSYDKKRNVLSLYKKIMSVMFHFWRTVIPILALLFILNFLPFEWDAFIKNMFCISTSYNGTWWYLQTYIIYIILFPLLYLILNRNILSVFFCIVSMTLGRYITYFLPVNYIYYFLYYLPFFLIGALFAKNNLMYRLSPSKNHTAFLILYILITLLFVFLRFKTGRTEFLFIIIPFFMLSFVQKPLGEIRLFRAIYILGKYSMGIWLIHNFFIKQIPCQAITNNCILHFILIFGLSFALTFIIEKARIAIIDIVQKK